MTNALPRVSVVIPCRNEEEFIGECLESIIANNYPVDRLEVLVVDGMSEDGTRAIIGDYVEEYSFVRLLDNPKRVTPSALNIGVANAMGEIIMRMDAHTFYEKDYIVRCIHLLGETKADNVGGKWKILPRNNSLIAKAIVKSLSHRFGVGNTYYRMEGLQEPRYVDTVPFFCCRKDLFSRVGLFNEDLVRGQDMEFSLRLKKAGCRTLLVPDIVSYYYARSDLKSFLKHNWTNGVWAIIPFSYSDVMPVSWRHLVPLIFVLLLLGTAAMGFFSNASFLLFFAIAVVYALASIVASVQIAWKGRDHRYFFLMPFVFGMLHFGYGLGSLKGVIQLAIEPSFWSRLISSRK